jgi:molecular chaperone GrpE (heat shock protein)
VLDAFDRVFRAVAAKPDAVTPQMNIWVGNFRAVRRLLERLLRDEGVARIETVAGEFDPRWHVVAETVVDPARASGAIVDEVKAGYVWRDAVLRKSEVIVVRNE